MTECRFKAGDKNGCMCYRSPWEIHEVFFVSQLIFNLLRLSFILSSVFSLCVEVRVEAVAAKEKEAMSNTRRLFSVNFQVRRKESVNTPMKKTLVAATSRVAYHFVHGRYVYITYMYMTTNL